MPRVKRRGHTLRGQLTLAEQLELLCGPGRESEFASDAERRQAYFEHADEIDGSANGGMSWAREQYTQRHARST